MEMLISREMQKLRSLLENGPPVEIVFQKETVLKGKSLYFEKYELKMEDLKYPTLYCSPMEEE